MEFLFIYTFIHSIQPKYFLLVSFNNTYFGIQPSSFEITIHSKHSFKIFIQNIHSKHSNHSSKTVIHSVHSESIPYATQRILIDFNYVQIKLIMGSNDN